MKNKTTIRSCTCYEWAIINVSASDINLNLYGGLQLFWDWRLTEYTELISGQFISSFSIHLQRTGLKESATCTALDLFFKQRKFWLDCEMALWNGNRRQENRATFEAGCISASACSRKSN